MSKPMTFVRGMLRPPGRGTKYWTADNGTRIYYPQTSNFGQFNFGEGCTIHSHCWIGDGVIIGDNVKIQAYAFIPPGVNIGNNVFIGPRVTFTNDRFPPAEADKWENTIVYDNAVIGAGVVIRCGLTLPRGVKIGAGSVVARVWKDTHNWWVGNPATPMNRRKIV